MPESRRVRSDQQPPSLLVNVVGGALGGLVGSWVMNRFDGVVHAARPDGRPSDQPGPAGRRRGVLAQNLSERGGSAAAKVGVGALRRLARREPPAPARHAAARATHYAFGGAMGAVYGLLTYAFPALARGRGVPAGALLWLVADEVAIPAVGLAAPPRRHAPVVHLYALAVHALFGFVADLVRRSVVRAAPATASPPARPTSGVTMPSRNAQAFMDALQRAERSRDPVPVAALFAPDAQVHSYTRDARGADAATFWRQYLGAFGSVRSTFTRVAESADEATLEWVSDGTLPDGSPIRYEGVSLLTFRGDRVVRFRTYYDSAAFVPPAVVAR